MPFDGCGDDGAPVFLWVCGGGFVSTPILIQGHDVAARSRQPIVCVGNRAYIATQSGQLLRWNIYAESKDGPGSLSHAQFETLSLQHGRVSAVSASRRNVVVVDDIGMVWSMGRDQDAFVQIPIKATRIVRVACGARFVIALSDHGTVLSWGDATDCLGRQPTSNEVDVIVNLPDNVVAIACGWAHACAVSAKGRLFVWGENRQGCLGTGDNNDRVLPVEVDLDNVTAVACGYQHTMCLTKSGKAFAWGCNMHGQCGDPSISTALVMPHEVPMSRTVIDIACGAFHSALITTDGDLFMFGLNNGGQLGLGDYDLRRQPVRIDSMLEKNVLAVFCGGLTTIALTQNLIGFSCSDDHFSLAHIETGSGWDQLGVVSSPQPPVMYQEIDGVDDSSPVRVASAAEQISNVFRLDDTSTSGASEPIRVSSDDQRYRRELHRMSQVYREKLLKDTHRQAVQQWQANSVIMEADRERERQLHLSQLRAAAVEASVKTWMNDILRDFNKRRDGRKALDLLYKTGIPPRLRSIVWPRAISNSLLINTELFSVFSARAKRIHMEILAKGEQNGSAALAVGRENTIYYIEVDLQRTFPSLAFFRRGQPLHSELRNLLQTYCCYRPDVGYVQGMSYLAGGLLLYLDPYTAFSTFANLLTMPLLHSFVRMDSEAMSTHYAIHACLLQGLLPRLHTHLFSEEVAISPQLYILEWFMTLFSKRLNLITSARSWDLIFTLPAPHVTIHRTAVAILACVQDRLVGQPFDDCMYVLNNETKAISVHELMSAMSGIRVPPSIVIQLDNLNNQIDR
ncbi:Rab-GAP TBC domain-containing protein [Plasmodiophora brassicae]